MVNTETNQSMLKSQRLIRLSLVRNGSNFLLKINNEDKLKQRIKELETTQTAKNSEIMVLYEKVDEFEQTNKNIQKGNLDITINFF